MGRDEQKAVNRQKLERCIKRRRILLANGDYIWPVPSAQNAELVLWALDDPNNRHLTPYAVPLSEVVKLLQEMGVV